MKTNPRAKIINAEELARSGSHGKLFLPWVSCGREQEPTAPKSCRGYPLSVFLPCLCFLCALSAPARAEEFTKASHYSLRMFSYGTFTLETRMGDLQIEGWDEPRLEIEAERVVQAKSAAKAQPLYDQIRIEVKGADKRVWVRTLYPPRRLWRPFRGETKLSVNYRIRMPYDANLILKCVDGDVRVRGIVGHQQIRVNYGDVEINIPSVDRLRSLSARTWLGYVQSDLHGEDHAGFAPRLSFWNTSGDQDIVVRVGMGGVYIYSEH